MAASEASSRSTTLKWRPGRKLGRTLYLQVGDNPGYDDKLVGMMDTPELANLVIHAVNKHLAEMEHQRAFWPAEPVHCQTCWGYGLWADGGGAMGAMDARDGMPTMKCPECGRNPNPIIDRP